ncbi:TPA: 16S rRNA pseudouridine(516) synthase [Enterococcus faecium]|uniref:16S rRNA pseudouridine(516) synthase n=1 Tax=Enterococcus sp. E5-37 TaxID=2996024 RepID=UPI001A0DDA22|nr:16S rRNA pseudouridine(516) synthase [Enterococcus sp. E5-37]EGP4943424.1 pseudouridine synthase [Enterococcus faecium]EME7160430.1 pseudouridine synthase [Enterococcus faecium]EME8212486.1 pseudouridine synthase [Enterococcus faecium]MDQ8332878.1 16S rRNA pseudouridine(516) synthase [Enterococcus faecium]MEB4608469.1 16S rRNA pseudouridine(516) synthase [Enterococcus sp. E5-37]
MRLDKLIEEKLETTRKEMKRLFALKQVMIDGTVEFRQNRNVDSLLHQIEVAGERLETNESYYLLNKPEKAVTAVSDPEKTTVIDLIASADRFQPLYPVGRLDRDTTGLLLITSNGQLGYEMLLPEKKVSKTYQVVVNERVTPADVTAFENGIVFDDGYQCKPADLKILKADKHQSTVLLTIQEGKFHQVKKMFLAQGKKVTALKRLSMGPLELDEQLGVGEYRSLTLAEMKKLSIYFK